jgi:4,4'-diaponeurosporenoate glycosyltransferase
MGPLLILLAVVLILSAAGFLLGARISACPDTVASHGLARQVSLVIPARNESHNLPKLLESIAAGDHPGEIIVVDDHSTDDTAEIARRYGSRVVPSQPLPDGWRGKTWACHQGAAAASGDLLLFMDADTWFEPGGLNRLLGCYTGGAFSAAPYHVTQKIYENLSLFFNINMVLGTIPRSLFGQLLLVDRVSYERAGGHAAVKEKILENFSMTKTFRTAGIPVRSVMGRDIIAFRMYPNGIDELVQGWTKAFASGASQTPGWILLLIILWLTGLMLVPLGWILSRDFLTWAAVYLLCAGQVRWISASVGSFRWLTALLYPVPLVFFFLLFAWSSLRSGKRVTWKGRQIHAD